MSAFNLPVLPETELHHRHVNRSAVISIVRAVNSIELCLACTALAGESETLWYNACMYVQFWSETLWYNARMYSFGRRVGDPVVQCLHVCTVLVGDPVVQCLHVCTALARSAVTADPAYSRATPRTREPPYKCAPVIQFVCF